jgi:cysteinyl-tRNA synthetase
MKLYNTLTRKTEEFKPINDEAVKLYSCGPTVYDNPHIGNWRSFVFVDTLRRTLELSGYKVKHVMNITDVGHLTSDADEGMDKLEAGAQREGKSVWDVANYYTNVFIAGAQSLNLLSPNGYSGPHGPYAKATDFIDQQIDIVKILKDKGYAYQTEEAIYFDVSKLPSYGELSGQKMTEKEIGARDDVITDKNKRNPQDFALWFFTVGRFASHQMRWSSPWGEGFPGWHLECSAIIHATLHDPIDIHTGGVDHIGTHHPNEMAQTEAAFGHRLANFWMHNEFVLVEGQKMAKSLGNIITLNDTTLKGYDPLELRLLFLQSHYKSQMNFTWPSLDAAQKRFKKYKAFADLRFQISSNFSNQNNTPDYKNAEKLIINAAQDDLSIPKSLSVFDSIIDKTNNLIPVNKQTEFSNFLKLADDLFGLKLLSSQDITEEQKKMITERETARSKNDWQAADQLRNQLKEQGLEINDTQSGPIWSRI